MSSTYRLKASQLDERFLQSLKVLYGDREVEICIAEVAEDETAYLLANEANREHLLRALENIEKGENLVTVKPEDLR
jgi:antitoxin YefM